MKIIRLKHPIPPAQAIPEGEEIPISKSEYEVIDFGESDEE